MRNVFSAVRYARAVLRSGTSDKVVVDREMLRTLVLAAENSPRGNRDAAVARRFADMVRRQP